MKIKENSENDVEDDKKSSIYTQLMRSIEVK